MIICPNWQMEFHVHTMLFISYWHYIGLEYIIDKYDQVLVYVSHVPFKKFFPWFSHNGSLGTTC